MLLGLLAQDLTTMSANDTVNPARNDQGQKGNSADTGQQRKQIRAAQLIATAMVFLIFSSQHMDHTHPTPCPQAGTLRFGGLVVDRVGCWQ